MTEIEARPVYEAPSIFQGLISNALVVDSGELIENENLGKLEKVPFVITSLAYRKGDIVKPGESEPGCYVSVTATIADEATLFKLHKFGRINMDEIPFMPEESIIFNDGSTGVKRQLTEMLHVRGIIAVVEKNTDLVIGGVSGGSSFDRKPHEWHEIYSGNLRYDEGGYGLYDVTLNQPLYCRRGLRPSVYDNDYAKGAKTYYLA